MASKEDFPAANVLIQTQLQDIIDAQQVAYKKLKQSVEEKGETIPLRQYDALLRDLENERIAHAKTKAQLMDTEDKLDFALGEIEILKKQIDREKTQFEKTFGLLKTKAIKETVKTVELETKCQAIKKEVKKTESVLTGKEKEVKSLEYKLKETEDAYKQQLNELTVQLQQELYIADVLRSGEKRKKPTESPRSVPTRR